MKAAGFGVDLDHVDPSDPPTDLRSVLTRLGRDLIGRETGLLQLVGFSIWRRSVDPAAGVTGEEVDAGIKEANDGSGG